MNTKRKNDKRCAFTLAEVLITLGVIGVVAAVTLPTLLTNVQDRVRQEQVRTVKYKFTKATDKMNSLGRIGQYGTPSENDSTEKFVEELKKHMNIAKVCDSTKLNECWPSQTITAYSGSSTTPQTVNVSTITKGSVLKALANTTADTATVGIVTSDGVPMILVYSPDCSGFDEAKQYTWSVENGKPVTNATTNCVSAIFDINGAKGPNKIGTDVRTLNSIFGSVDLGAGSAYGYADTAICNNMRKKYGFKYCTLSQDYWVGAIYACDKLGLHLPTMSTLANIANARYGTSQIGPYTMYMGKVHASSKSVDCKTWIKENWSSSYVTGSDEILCNVDTSTVGNSSLNTSEISTINGFYWANTSRSASSSASRYLGGEYSTWRSDSRNDTRRALCVGD